MKRKRSAVDGPSVAQTTKRWYERAVLLAIALAIVPPIGVVLAWCHRRLGVWLKLALTVCGAVSSMFDLWLWFGLTVEFSGGFRGRLVFRNERRQAARIERHRQQQRDRTGTIASTLPDSGAAAVTGWPGFRGSHRDGVATEPGVFKAWPADGLTPLWRQPCGGGYASFAIEAGRACTIEQRGDREVIACYDLATGTELWSHGYAAHFREVLGGPGPRATPAIAGGRVFALGAEGHLTCLELGTGKRIWQTNVLADNGAKNLDWGMADSPLVDAGRVIVTPGGGKGKLINAYDVRTGRLVGRGGDDQPSYASPQISTIAGMRQLVVFSANQVGGYSLDDLQPLWSYPWRTQPGVVADQPIVTGDDRVFIASGYDRGCALLGVRRESSGSWHVERMWENKNLKAKFAGSVLHDGHIYGLDEGILVCIEIETGRRRWKAGRYGHGQLLLAGDSLIVLAENGDLALVAATPDRFAELGRFHAIDGKTWNHPALADGKLVVRNAEEMACFSMGALNR